MTSFLQKFLENKNFATLELILGFILLACFIYFYIEKNGRDERGRSIFAKASFIALISFMVLVNIFANAISLLPIKLTAFTVTHMLQILFNIVLLIHIFATLIFRKLN